MDFQLIDYIVDGLQLLMDFQLTEFILMEFMLMDLTECRIFSLQKNVLFASPKSKNIKDPATQLAF